MFYGQGPSPFMSNSFGFGGMGGAMGAPQQAPQAPQGPRPMAQGAQPGGNSGQLWNRVLNDPGPRVGDPYQQPTSRPTMGPGQSWQAMGPQLQGAGSGFGGGGFHFPPGLQAPQGPMRQSSGPSMGGGMGGPQGGGMGLRPMGPPSTPAGMAGGQGPWSGMVTPQSGGFGPPRNFMPGYGPQQSPMPQPPGGQAPQYLSGLQQFLERLQAGGGSWLPKTPMGCQLWPGPIVGRDVGCW
jgi:hypothetical protein